MQCRDEWISSLVDELDESDSYEFVKHLTDIYRLHLFDAIMQYRAIFFDNSGPSAQGAAAGSGGAAATSGLQQGTVQDTLALVAVVKESSILHSWVQHRLSLYLHALRQHLPNITEGGNLSSVLEHCMVCVVWDLVRMHGPLAYMPMHAYHCAVLWLLAGSCWHGFPGPAAPYV